MNDILSGRKPMLSLLIIGVTILSIASLILPSAGEITFSMGNMEMTLIMIARLGAAFVRYIAIAIIISASAILTYRSLT